MSTELQKIHCLETKVRGLEKKLEDTDELDRNNDRFPGILIWRSVGESIDDAVESLFNGWNKCQADNLVHNVQDLFWHISEDKANQYEVNKEIMNGDWYRKPLFVKRKDNQAQPQSSDISDAD